MKHHNMHSPDLLRQLLQYDPASGILRWKLRDRSFFGSDAEYKRWNGRYAGKTAFTPNTNGYLDGYVLRVMHRAHHIAWALYYDEAPAEYIDHINGNRADNRIENLRQVSARQNARNAKVKSTNKSGVIGVCRHETGWRATIMGDNKQIHLGVFKRIEDAVAARKAAERRLGYHKNHGRLASLSAGATSA